jgi:hypothetical protein
VQAAPMRDLVGGIHALFLLFLLKSEVAEGPEGSYVGDGKVWLQCTSVHGQHALC